VTCQSWFEHNFPTIRPFWEFNQLLCPFTLLQTLQVRSVTILTALHFVVWSFQPLFTLASNSRLAKGQHGYKHERNEGFECRRKGYVIREVEKERKEKKADACRKFDLVNWTIQTIWKNRTTIVIAFEQNGWRTKRLRKPEARDVGGVVHKWFKRQRSDSTALSGPLVMTEPRDLRGSWVMKSCAVLAGLADWSCVTFPSGKWAAKSGV
jgi:hypothetical protein